MTNQGKIKWYSTLHKQNLNGRETEDELFEAGISAGIEETEELQDEFAINFVDWVNVNAYKYPTATTTLELLLIFKKQLNKQ
jgi:hypothetical protein